MVKIKHTFREEDDANTCTKHKEPRPKMEFPKPTMIHYKKKKAS